VPEPTVTAVVINYRSGDHLQSCLEGLLADRDFLARVIVVDNASGDGSHQPARRAAAVDPRVEVRMSEANLGLAGGVNLVLGEVRTPFLAILNPDVTPRPGWLSPLVDRLEADASVAAACPLILMKGDGRINSAGQLLHVSGLGFNRRLGRRVDSVGAAAHEVGGLHGAAFVIRTETLRRIGGWDQTGFLYHEDVALSWDLLLSGKAIVCDPKSVVEHDYHLTMYPEKLHLLERNRWALLLSHLRWGRLLAVSPAILATELMVWALSLIRGPRFLAAKARSYRWLAANRGAIREWRGRVMARPVYDLDRLRRHTGWAYPLSQITGLGIERRASSRVPPGGLPT
jgi:GT2 family glycosyltransferase